MKTRLEQDIKALANPEQREVLMRFFKTGKGQYGEGDRFHSDCTLLYEMASPARSLWENRIAIVTTMQFIRHGDFSHTLAIADRLMTHPHDLIHKAVGWMLRGRPVGRLFIAKSPCVRQGRGFEIVGEKTSRRSWEHAQERGSPIVSRARSRSTRTRQ